MKLIAERPTLPTYSALVKLYYFAECRVIAESSGQIYKDTLALWRKCRDWLAWIGRASELPADETIQLYLAWEQEGSNDSSEGR